MIRRLGSHLRRLRGWLANPVAGLDTPDARRDCPGGACLPVPEKRAPGEDSR